MVRDNAWRRSDPHHAAGAPRIDLKVGGADVFVMPVKDGDGVNAAPKIPYRGLDHFGLAVSGIDARGSRAQGQGRRIHHGADQCAAGRARLLLARARRRVGRAVGAELVGSLRRSRRVPSRRGDAVMTEVHAVGVPAKDAAARSSSWHPSRLGAVRLAPQADDLSAAASRSSSSHRCSQSRPRPCCAAR